MTENVVKLSTGFESIKSKLQRRGTDTAVALHVVKEAVKLVDAIAMALNTSAQSKDRLSPTFLTRRPLLRLGSLRLLGQLVRVVQRV